MKKIILVAAFLFFSHSHGQTALGTFKLGDNSGKNKLERIESLEKHLVQMNTMLRELKQNVDNSGKDKDLKKKVDDLTQKQKQILVDVEDLKSNQVPNLKKKVEFIDVEKVEKIIEKFNLYKEETDKKLKVLQDSLKEIDEQLKSVGSPIKT
ncbi:hypothetical protein A9Q84_06305 [Halobacteriovorax marinus]|uniref:Secreted protein n=1 Tax=Halobacteriovorax marinus TaxID=97084 RepID=A0A1Y5F9E9_9BACT|nr:hypothetical protein A9Q84_06305 [Halobacteriovorax marinus]